MSLLEERNYYKPFEYPWMYEMYKKHENMHWLADEVEFREDVNDWVNKLTDNEKNLLTQLFRFFTQADVDVAGGYYNLFIPALGNCPEAIMMMGSFANRENVHIDAYSTLIETVGMPENTYQAFSEYIEMEAKHDFVSSFTTENPYEMLKSVAVYSGFTEGMQLFSSFAILLNFARFGKMKAMCNIVRWSIRDESVHVEGMTKLFRELLKENPDVDVDKLEGDIAEIAELMVILEDQFIDLCFEQGGIDGLEADEVKAYIRYIANKRWTQLGFSGKLYEEHDRNPLDWIEEIVNGVEHTNFFEAQSTEYSKAALTDDGEVEW